MPIIPNELIIILHTTIPGYQNIKYVPNMTIKDIKSNDKSIRFDPLIKLNKKVIDKIPDNYRIKQFFNRELFQSLLNYTNSSPAKNLHEATVKGFVDNNIKVTLNTIFNENSIIYIADNSYIITDFQWTNGDWKIDTKTKKGQIESTKIKNPYLYQSVVKDKIITGEKELKQLSPSEIYGNNYNGIPNINIISGGETTKSFKSKSIFFSKKINKFNKSNKEKRIDYLEGGNSPYAYKLMKKEEDKELNQLAYYITIELELHPGTTISPEEMKNYKCRQKWNSIRKAYADLTGKPYVISPIYQNKSFKNKTRKYGRRKKNITYNNKSYLS
jgi:hypothetical protein